MHLIKACLAARDIRTTREKRREGFVVNQLGIRLQDGIEELYGQIASSQSAA
jgi:hypothetical protein